MKPMSKKESATPVAEQKKEKVMTKYDLKMQKRKEEEARRKKEERSGKIIAAVVIIALIAFVASFPIRKYMALNGTYITVGEEKITQVEFDYNYAVAKVGYLDTYGSYLSMFGMDTATIDDQSYDGTMTFREYFEQLAVQNIASTKALKAAAEAENFVYDTTLDYEMFIAEMSAQAATAGMPLKEYITDMYGPLATQDRLEDIIKETLYTGAYYEKKANSLVATDDEIVAYYDANKGTYDSVDYRMVTIKAELPTTNPDGSKPVDAEGKEIAYVPTEEEKATAMAAAKVKAEEALKTVATDGEVFTNALQSSINSKVSSWLFEEGRKAGDTYMAEDTVNSTYIVVAFEKRYRDDVSSADMRIIMSSQTDSQTILKEWESGAKTEDSFVELLAKYDETGAASFGGLYEGIGSSVLPEGASDWVRDSARKAGDTYAVNAEDGTNYVFYYVAAGDPAWKNSINNTLLNQKMNDYMEEITAAYTVKEGRGKLGYLHLDEKIAETETAQ